MNAPDRLMLAMAGMGPDAKAASTTPRLLLVDDDAMLRHMAARTLRHAGFEVVDAADGEAGLAAFAAQAFDLVLLDVMLPGLDGFEVCQRLRTLPRGARVPVIMLTGLNDTGSIEQAYGHGATDFITKPINWTLLSHRVRYALRAAESADTLRLGRERLARAQRLAGMGSWACTADGRLECSPELARLYGANSPDQASWFTTADALLARVLPTERDAVTQARRGLFDEGRAYQIEYRIERLDGQLRTLHEQAMPLQDESGLRQGQGVEGITQDVTERVQAQQRIRQLAHYDSVTGLPNRQFFAELAAPALQRAQRLGRQCAVLHVDIDQFKAVNDAFGRSAGDQVLQTVAERLGGWIRGTDLATSGESDAGGLVARVGGNAFTLLITDLAGQAPAEGVAQRLLEALARPVTLPGLHEPGAPGAPSTTAAPLVLSAAIGIALYPGDAPDLAGLTRCAEQAAYAAKAHGRGQLRFFDQTLDAQATRRLRMETELRRAIEGGELRLHFQPKVVIDGDGDGDGSASGVGRIAGAEALVRWQHPERGLVPPGEFIPLAEECGLIAPLTDWVLASACRHLQAWQEAGLPALTLAVNLSAPSFADPALDTRLQVLLARHGLTPASLVLEVTESLLMREPEATAARLAALRAQGFALSLDDFGTGYSSLSYLKRFPIDELKIDRSFVVDAARGGRDSALAKAIIALGCDLGLRVVAEGVETAEQAAFLRRQGCQWHQGWLYARALPADDFAALLARGLQPPPGAGDDPA